MLLLENKELMNQRKHHTTKMINHATSNVTKRIDETFNPKEKKEIEKLEKSLEEAKAILKMNDKNIIQYSTLVQRKLLSILDGLNNLLYGVDMLSRSLIIAINAIGMGVCSIIYALFKKLTIDADKKILQRNTKKIIKKLESLEKELPNNERDKIRKEIDKLNKLL